ncbi:MAG TPA: AAA family ATPase, partial [Solirubrobacteraceae bacterium]|nr:AAA family ATPase [Solirubrobacteraceae bacterium]
IGAVRRGTGGALLVVGEGGIGKSRLVRELRAAFEAGGDDGRWLHARCASYGEDVPYRPVRALLLDWLRAGGDGAPAQRLRAACRDVLGDDAEGVEPFLLALLDEPGEDGPVLAPEGVQARTVAAVAALLGALAARGPLVVTLDDLHWADPSSLELLDSLLELTDDAALLLVLSARPERDHGSWGLRERALRDLPHRAHELSLDVLAGDDDRALLDALVGRGALPPTLERRILERAEGNPFYLEETVRSLLETGALARTADGWRLDPEAEVEVPETVEKLVLSRIDRLGPDRHAVLSAAAVLGRQFDLPVLERVMDGNDPRPALRDLQRLELVREGRRWPVPEYSFRHSLIQEAAYGALLRRHRQELHRRAAAAIAEVHAAALDDQAGVLARHHHEAGDLEQAYALHGRAADAALRIHAQEEALEHLDGALSAAAALGRGPEDAEVRRLFARRGGVRYAAAGDFEGSTADLRTSARGARAAGDAALEVEALLSLSGTLRRSDWAAAVEAMDEAVAVARSLGDPAVLAGALARQSITHANLLRLETAQAVGEEALQTAAGTDDPRARIAALDALKLTALMLGDLPRLDALCGELLELLDNLASAPETADGPGLLPRVYRAWALQESAFVPAGAGRWEDAEGRLRAGLDLVERDGYVTYKPLFLDTLARLRRGAGDLAGALAAADEGAELARRRGNHEWRAWPEATAGWALLGA